MALQGTLDTFALPDVLRLLATTGKTGQLLVQGEQGNGNLYLSDGAVVDGDTSLAPTDEHHEVLFELLRLSDGSFMFDQGTTAADPGAAVDVESVIEAAESAHTEWQELSEVVPSLDVGILLADDLPEDTTTIDRDRWKLIVTIGSGTTVRALGDQLGLKELPVLRATRSLVDDGLAAVGEATDIAAPVEPATMPDLTAQPDPIPMDDPVALDGAGDLLPSLDDETAGEDLFDDVTGGDDLPEPLLGGSTGDGAPDLLPEEAAALQGQLEGLPPAQRELVERAADVDDPAEAAQMLEELPDGVIDRDLMRRFLGSVRS